MSSLTIPKGADWSYAIPILDGNNEPVNVTGWSARAHVRANKWFSFLPVLHEWKTTGPSPNATLASSLLTLKVTPAVSIAWTWWTGVYDIELTHSDGRKAQLGPFNVDVLPEVTRD